MEATLIQRGEELDVYALAKGVRCQADNFLMALSLAERRSVRALLKMTADRGTLRNTETLRYEEDKIWAFRRRNGVRLYCFRGTHEGRPTIVITHGVRKKQNKARPSDLKKAKKDRRTFIEGGSHYES